MSLVELPGHGPRVEEAFTLARCAAVIHEAVLSVPASDDPIVVGHSLGGYATMAYAARYPTEPAGLVLAGCSTTPTGPGAKLYRGVAALTDRLGPARMTRVNNRVLHRLYPPDRIDPVIAGGYYFEPTAAAWAEVMRHCRPAMLSDVRCPVLLLNGQFDQFRFGTRPFVAACPQAKVEIVKKAGHLSNLDRPIAFAEALVRFADSVTGR